MIPRSEVALRGALPEDAPTIAEIWHLGWRDGHLGFVSQELIDARHEDSFRTRAAQRVNDTTVAVVQGQIAGFVMVVDNEVEQVYVSVLHRGEGVADMLMVDAERRIKDAGYRLLGSLWWRGMREPGGSMNAAAGPTGVYSSTPRQVTTVQSLCLLIDMKRISSSKPN
jgi:GNAT superfamily N-acetyltransferase